MTQPIILCLGRKINNPMHPLWRLECLGCLRRMAITKPTDIVINPWTGHGSCPDKLEQK